MITAPLVVLFTAGYRYQFDTGRIVQTGVLNVQSYPKGANVWIDDVQQEEHTPAVIDDVAPGEHVVRIQKDGYSSWKKTIEIQSRQSTFISQIVLFLPDQPIQFFDTPPSPPTDVATLWQPAFGTFQIQQTSHQSLLTQLNDQQLSTIIAYLPLSDYTLETAPAPYLLLRDDTRERIVLIDTQQASQPILLNTDANQWAWSPSGHALLFSDGFDVEVYYPSVHARETMTRLSQPIAGLRWYPIGHIAVFHQGSTLYAQEIDRHGEPNKTILLEGLSVTKFWFEEEGDFLVGVLQTEEGKQGFKKRLQK